MFGDFIIVKDAKAFDISVTVEIRDLIGSQRRRTPVGDRMKAKFPLDRAQLLLLGNDFELRLVGHDTPPQITAAADPRLTQITKPESSIIDDKASVFIVVSRIFTHIFNLKEAVNRFSGGILCSLADHF